MSIQGANTLMDTLVEAANPLAGESVATAGPLRLGDTPRDADNLEVAVLAISEGARRVMVRMRDTEFRPI